jgi:hypothetical protein
MLAEARRAVPDAEWVCADARALPARDAFDLAVSFGAFGHFLPHERTTLFSQVHGALRSGGLFAFPVAAPPPVGSRQYWALWGFDAAMRVRNALWRPQFVMYYRRFRLPEVRRDLVDAGFTVTTLALEALGRLPDGSPRCRLVVARRRD